MENNFKSTDYIQPFLLNNSGWRGELIQAKQSLEDLFRYHEYSETIKTDLSYLSMSVLLLISPLKFKGNLSLQIMGMPKTKFLLARTNENLVFKALARLNEKNEGNYSNNENPILVLSLQPDEGEMTQSIIAFDSESIETIIENYFYQSEQIKTYLFLKREAQGAYGLLLQKLPKGDEDLAHEKIFIREEFLNYNFNAYKKNEANPFKSTENFLTSLFDEEDIFLFEKKFLTYSCDCSLEKIKTTLDLLTQEDKNYLNENKNENKTPLRIRCEFCNKDYDL